MRYCSEENHGFSEGEKAKMLWPYDVKRWFSKDGYRGTNGRKKRTKKTNGEMGQQLKNMERVYDEGAEGESQRQRRMEDVCQVMGAPTAIIGYGLNDE